MDGLSAAASVIAVTSLAFQLAHSTKKLFDFWESIQDAPDEVRKVKTDLKFLTKVLEHIAHGAQQQSSDPLMESALRLCSDKIDTIMSLTLDLEPEFASRKRFIRKWGAFRLILKREKLKRLQKSLDRAKETLMMVQLGHIGYWELFVSNYSCVPFIFRAADVEVEFHRESSRLRDTAQFEQISALAHKINSLDLKNLEGKVTTTANGASDMAEHTLARKAEVNRVSLSIESDALAFGFRKAAQTAFDRFPGTTQDESGISDPLVQLCHPMRPAPSGELVYVKRTISQEDRVVETLFGTFRISRKTSILSSDRSPSHVTADEEDQYEHESRFSLVPPSWLVRLGFTRIISARVSQSSLAGPILGLDTLRTVPYDAPIFELCSLGDVDGVEALMTEGKASVKDVDLYGRTPLYVAAEGHHVELCRLLIRGGADRDARIYDDADIPYINVRNPLFAIGCRQWLSRRQGFSPSYNARRAIDVLRLFIDLIDVSNTDGDRWTSGSKIMSIMSEYHTPNTPNGGEDDALIWLIQTLGPTFWSSFKDEGLQEAMFWSFQYAPERMSYLLEFSGTNVDATNGEGGWSLLHYAVLHVSSFESHRLLAMGANIHLVGFEPEWSPEEETPASLALYRANTFMALQDTLRDAMVDLDDFVTLELQQTPLQESTWTKDTLSALFCKDFDNFAFARPATFICSFCARWRAAIVQPSWILALRAITSGNLSRDVPDNIDSSMSVGWQPRYIPTEILASRVDPDR